MVQVRQVPLEAIVLKNEAPRMDSALRIQIYPKKGISPIILFWGWELSTINPTLSREVSGFLVVFQNSWLCQEQYTPEV